MKSHIENCKQWLRQRLLQIRQRMPNSEIELSDSTSADHHAEDVMIAKVVVPAAPPHPDLLPACGFKACGRAAKRFCLSSPARSAGRGTARQRGGGTCGGLYALTDRASVAAHAPSTALRAVPLPRLAGQDGRYHATKTERAGVAVSAADDVQAMERAAVSRAARLSGAGAVHASGILARLRQRTLPPRAPLSRSAAVLLRAQAGDGAGRMGEGGSGLPAAARTVVARFAERLGRPVIVLSGNNPPPRAARGRGTARSAVEGACGGEASLGGPRPFHRPSGGPPSPLRGAGWRAYRFAICYPRFAARNSPFAR